VKYNLIIFDFDGTLADTLPWYTGIVNKVADKYKFKRVQKSEWEIVRGYDVNKLFKYLDVPLWKIPVIVKHLRTLLAKDINQVSLFKGIDYLLKLLANNGVMLAIVTKNSYENVSKILGSECSGLIKYYECGVSIFGKKVKLKKVLRKSGIPLSESIYIGDEIGDSEAATKVNIAFGAVSWGYNTIESLKAHTPKEIFVSIDEIVEKII
jgi:phosphoglycolate phosphatase